MARKPAWLLARARMRVRLRAGQIYRLRLIPAWQYVLCSGAYLVGQGLDLSKWLFHANFMHKTGLSPCPVFIVSYINNSIHDPGLDRGA